MDVYTIKETVNLIERLRNEETFLYCLIGDSTVPLSRESERSLYKLAVEKDKEIAELEVTLRNLVLLDKVV